MSFEYERVPDRQGLRLHLNENTGGCSPAVIDALRDLDTTDLAFYPDYGGATADCAAYFGVEGSQVLLTNGLDEGILIAAIAYLRGTPHPQVVIIEPAFDMYAACAFALGADIVTVAPRADFGFPLDEVVRAITSETRMVFLTNPNNPTGQTISRDAIRLVASRVREPGIVFLDEAYADFSGDTFADELSGHPNVVIGKTFAKAFGLAALRMGALVAKADRIATIRRIIPPYSVNVCALRGLRAALRDRDYVDWYVDQVRQSKQLLYDACDRFRFRYWTSAANFVLVRVGDGASSLVEALAERAIFVRDRTNEPGCAGCIRITTGVVDHTLACIKAIEDILCGAD